jgi:DNA-binding transcriptional LysR family regulator
LIRETSGQRAMKPIKINIDQLITFYFIAKEGGITDASELLCLSQPAVTMQVSALQKYFGVKLINVKKKRVHLTKAGKELFPYAEEIYRTAMKAESLLVSYRNNNLRIGISGALTLFIIPVVDRFKALYPTVRMTIREGRTRNLTTELLDFQHDLCIVGTVDNVQKELQVFRIPGIEKMVLVASPEDVLARKRSVTWKELEGYPLILLGEGSAARDRILNEFEKRGLSPHIAADIDSVEGMKQLIAKGKGVGLMFPPNVSQEISVGKLTSVPLEGGDVKIDIDVVIHREVSLSPPAERFLALIRKHFGCEIPSP